MSIDLENIKKNKKETDPQEVRYRRRKDAIKNFAIVFLVIMLVLTFFSNTIMNYSLPQVAVQYMESGSITTTIRGTGTVESGDPYNVKVNETRTVSSVNCRVGQEVHKGDILFTMSAGDSKEVEDAKKALEDAQDAYNNELLSDEVTSAIMASSTGSININDFRNKITAAQNAINEAQKSVDEQQKVVDDLTYQKNSADSSSTPSAEYTNAKANVTKTYDAYIAAKAELDKLNEVDNVFADWDQAIKNCDSISKDVIDKEAELTAASEYYNSIANDDSVTESDKEIARSAVTTLNNEYNELVARKSEAENAKNEAENTYNQIVVTYADEIANEATIRANYNTSMTAYEEALATLEKIEATQGTTGGNSNASNIQYQLTVAENELAKRKTFLAEKENDLATLISDINIIRKLNDLNDAIVEAQKELDKVTTASAARDITAPIDGTILSVYVTSGKETIADDPAVIIQPVGQTFTMSFTVTNDEAKAISIGANATVANSWWYNDVTGYVESIRPDPMSPNTSKKVTLNLSGSLTSGQTLTMSIDSRTSNYDSIVPNSAIHEDKNGKFILVVQSKSSPLGNRYFAVRYDVQVLASDDTKSAVKAGLEGYEYVITTSSKPISAGDQVRLSEN